MAILIVVKEKDGSVRIEGELPDTHVFSDRYVRQAVEDGWMEYSGKELKYVVHPDPMGQMQYAGELKLALPGDHLVLHVADGDVTYRITHPPVPQFFRLVDENEEQGVRIAPEFGLERVS